MADNCSVLDPWVYHSNRRGSARSLPARTRPSPWPPDLLSDTTTSSSSSSSAASADTLSSSSSSSTTLPSCSSASGDATFAGGMPRPGPAGAGLEEEVARVEAVGHHLHLRRPDRLPGGGAAGDGVPARGGATGEARAGTVRGGRPGGPATDPPAHARHLGVFSGYGRGRDPEWGLLVRVTTTCLHAGLRLRSTTPGLPYAGFVGCHVEEIALDV
ncbi:unnamed protein product [Musa acuminata subsp. burmannicoides]